MSDQRASTNTTNTTRVAPPKAILPISKPPKPKAKPTKKVAPPKRLLKPTKIKSTIKTAKRVAPPKKIINNEKREPKGLLAMFNGMEIKEFDSKGVDIVITHMPCIDGAIAASVVVKWHEEHHLQRPEVLGYCPYDFEDEGKFRIPDVMGKRVVMVDITFPERVMSVLVAKAKTLVVLDHHKTA